MLNPKEMAERFNVTVKTLQVWDRNGTLVAFRTPTNRRYYTEQQYLEFARNYTNGEGITLDEIIADIGSGLNNFVLNLMQRLSFLPIQTYRHTKI